MAAIKELEITYEYTPTDIIKKKVEERKVRLARHQMESDRENMGKEAFT